MNRVPPKLQERFGAGRPGDSPQAWRNKAPRSEDQLRAKRARRKPDPQHTRETILEAAREVLAQDGKEGLSVAEVAERAGVNRSTAYQHFQTRDQLVEATVAWVSDGLYQAAFGDPVFPSDQPAESIDMEAVHLHLVNFLMENPALGCVWLLEVLSSHHPASDPFLRQYKSSFERFAQTQFAQPGIDVEVLSILFLAGLFIWPIWARAQVSTAGERQEMSARFTYEILRLALHGTRRSQSAESAHED